MSADLVPVEKRPSQWDKRVAAAYLRMMQRTQTSTAKGVGVCIRTIRIWENHESWPRARQEARDRWLGDVVDSARMRLKASLQGELNTGDLALKVLERTDPDLIPAKQRVAVEGDLPAIKFKLTDDE